MEEISSLVLIWSAAPRMGPLVFTLFGGWLRRWIWSDRPGMISLSPDLCILVLRWRRKVRDWLAMDMKGGRIASTGTIKIDGHHSLSP